MARSLDWKPWEYNERYRAPVHSCGRCALRASYFTDQKLDEDEDSSASAALRRGDIGQYLTSSFDWRRANSVYGEF